MNLAHRLALLVAGRLKIRARSEKPGLLGRSSALTVADTDWSEARLCGARAVAAAAEGRGGVMVTLIRGANSPYTVDTGLALLEDVAFAERPFPSDWRHREGNDILPAFREYAAPLVGEIPAHRQLDEVEVSKRSL